MYKFNELSPRRFPLKELYNVTLVTNITYLTQLTFRTIDNWLNDVSEDDKYVLVKLRKKLHYYNYLLKADNYKSVYKIGNIIREIRADVNAIVKKYIGD
nr:MAG TPA: hypothetical protein [Caudoviricetes sp.]